jgi:UDP-glucose 4-epimerase
VSALLGLTLREAAVGKVYNVGSSEEVRILELAAKVKQIVDSSSEISLIPYAEAYAPNFEDMHRRVPDVSRIQGLLGWQPQFSLEQILVRVRDSLREAKPIATCEES